MDAFPINIAYTAMEVKFERACSKLTILNAKIAATKLQHHTACPVNRLSIRHSPLTQLVETEGVRNMYYQYARAKPQPRLKNKTT
jgi:hypothetical protein